MYELYTVDDIFPQTVQNCWTPVQSWQKAAPPTKAALLGSMWTCRFAAKLIRFRQQRQIPHCGNHRPAGYLLDSTYGSFFTYEGKQIAWQVVDATNTNLRTSVDISKQDITNGKELPGAKLEIRATDGNLVEGWTSGKVPHTVRV